MENCEQGLDVFPWLRILPRWIFGAAEIGLAVYLVITFHLDIGLVYCAYWVFSLLVLLPLLRCTKCYYHGKRCSSGWGIYSGFIFPQGEQVYFQAGYGFTILLWPLRLAPIGLGLLNLMDGVVFNPDGLFGIYIAVIIIHRLYYRLISCPACCQKETCPVYNSAVLGKQKSARQ
ncbi:MAG: hypothetical protein J7K40_09750 [candidate division Zixibacteria bacterium]|nr:hypothetical protein [candidate division Zixibacteria bacterium]